MKLSKPYTRKQNGERKRLSKAQASIELTIAWVASILLLVGVIKIFVWMNSSMVERQINYQKTRADVDNHIVRFKYTDKSAPPGPESAKLDIFNMY